MLAIDCKGLTKRFGELTAVDRVNFKVKQNEVFGLLGPNGAGKTTTIRMLTTVIPPTEGTAMVAGHDVIKEPDKIREKIGVILQLPALDWFLSVYDNFDIYGRIQRIPKKERKEKIDFLLEEFGLEEKRKTKIELLSGGLDRRVQVARAFMPKHEILFLDEPTLGLDPQSKLKVWDLVKEHSKGGETIVITTHNMEEADYLCDRIGIIDHGKIIALDSPKVLKGRLGGGDIIKIDVEGDSRYVESEISKLGYVRNLGGLTIQVDNADKILSDLTQFITSKLGGLTIQVDNADKILSDLTQFITSKGRKIKSISVRKPTLEDVFIKLTGREIR
jgi:ABC-2 type transport system ATP-binding protein